MPEAEIPAGTEAAKDPSARPLDRYFATLMASGLPRPDGPLRRPTSGFALIDEPELLNMISTFARPFNYRVVPPSVYPGETEFTVPEADFRTDEAFRGMGKIASATQLMPTVSARARKALGESDDPRATAELSAIVSSKLPDAIKAEAVAALGNQMTAFGNVSAADLLGSLAESPVHDPLNDAARLIVSQIGQPTYPGFSLRPLTRSKSRLVSEPAVQALARVHSLDPRLREEDVFIIEKLKALKLGEIARAIDDQERELKSLIKVPGKTPDSEAKLKTARDSMAKSKAEQARVTRTKPLEFGVEMIGEFDRITNSTKRIILPNKGGPSIDLLASRFPLVRYNYVGEKLGPDGKSELCFLTIDVSEISPDDDDPDIARMKREKYDRAVVLHRALGKLSVIGIVAVKKLYIQELVRKSGGMQTATMAAPLPPMPNQDAEMKQFFDLLNDAAPDKISLDTKRRMIECFSTKPDFAFEYFAEPSMALRSDAAFEGMKQIAMSNTSPIALDAIRAIGGVYDTRASEILAGVANSSLPEVVRIEAIKGLSAQMTRGLLLSAESLGAIAQTATDGPTKTAAIASVSGIRQSNIPALAMFKFYHSKVDLLQQAAKEALANRMALDDRLNDTDLQWLAVAREWRYVRLKELIDAEQVEIAESRALIAKTKDTQSVIDRERENIKNHEKTIQRLKDDSFRFGRLKPVEFGVDLYDQLTQLVRGGEAMKQKLEQIAQTVNSLEEFNRNNSVIEQVSVTYENGYGQRVKQDEFQLNDAALGNMLMSVFAKAAQRRAEWEARENARISQKIQSLLEPLSKETKQVLAEGWQRKFFNDSRAKRAGGKPEQK